MQELRYLTGRIGLCLTAATVRFPVTQSRKFISIAGDVGSILRCGENTLRVADTKPYTSGLQLGSYPNPFRDHTTITYKLSTGSSVSLSIINDFE